MKDMNSKLKNRKSSGIREFKKLNNSKDSILLGKIIKQKKLKKQKGFTQVPNSVLRDEDISIRARLLYSVLLSYAWEQDFCFPSQDSLADDMGCSARNIRNILKELLEENYIEIVRRGYEETNIYILKKLPDNKKPIKRYDDLFGGKKSQVKNAVY